MVTYTEYIIVYFGPFWYKAHIINMNDIYKHPFIMFGYYKYLYLNVSYIYSVPHIITSIIPLNFHYFSKEIVTT